MKLLIAVIIAFSIVSFHNNKAEAGFMIEPYLGYEIGKMTLEGTINNTPIPPVEGDFNGFNLGARLGFTMLTFSAGVDYMLTTGDDDNNTESSINHLGVFVGFDFPVLLRLYAVYMFSVTNSYKDSNGSDVDYEGSGYKVGLGFTGLPLVSINLDMIVREFDEETGTVLGLPYELSLKSASTMLSISVPF